MATENNQEIDTTLKELFSELLRVEEDKLTLEAKLMEDLELDSLDRIEIVSAIEDKFDVQIPDETLKDIQTYGDIIDGLTTALAAKGA